jgi:hypothetical protein
MKIFTKTEFSEEHASSIFKKGEGPSHFFQKGLEIFYHTSWCHMPEEYTLHSLCHVNLGSHLMKSNL